MKAIVVDDEIVQVESLRRGLSSRGYQVVEALNAKEALKHLNGDNNIGLAGEDNNIDLVITDYAMPGMNGIEFLKELRKRYRSLAVIMMTAYGEKAIVIEALRNHCDGFIEKPFTLDQLICEIERTKVNLLQNSDSHQLSELLPKLVHQINNPLMSIMANAEIGSLQVDDPEDNPEEVKNSLSMIVEATIKIREINRRILILGRGIEGTSERVNLKAILDDCLSMFKGLITLKDISVEKELNAAHLYVEGNWFGLEQVFNNLILNAIDSMDGRLEKRLTIGVEMHRAASSVSVNIQDTGCGLSPESVDKIFETYFTSKKNGTGLGLPVVKEIIERHKGKIHIDSQVGKGSTFRVDLPMVNG